MSVFPRLRRSHDRIVAGVCAGIADYLGPGWTPTTIRGLFALVAVVSAGVPVVLIYGVLTLVMLPPPPDARFPSA